MLTVKQLVQNVESADSVNKKKSSTRRNSKNAALLIYQDHALTINSPQCPI